MAKEKKEYKERAEHVFNEYDMFSYYKVRLRTFRRLLATNPADPAIHDTHIINRQRKLILDKSELNSAINKYLGALDISETKEQAEREALLNKLEELTGVTLTPKERSDAIAGKLDGIKETFKDLEMSGLTVFFWNTELDLPMLGSHMILGFLKASAEAQCSHLRNSGKSEVGVIMKSTAYTQKCINMHCSVVQEFITLDKDVKRTETGESKLFQRSLRAKTADGPRTCLAKSEEVEAGTHLEFELQILKGTPLDSLPVLKQLFAYGRQKGLAQWRNADNGKFDTLVLEKITTTELG